MVEIDKLEVIGISVQTTNKGNQSAQDIGNHWAKFYAYNIAEKVSNKISNEVYSIYTDYKSDYTDTYTTIIGFPVYSLNNIPKGLVGRQFEAETFEDFTAKGPMPTAIFETWIGIWQRDKELQRKYTYDFEVHGDKSKNGEASEVKIHVATRKQ